MTQVKAKLRKDMLLLVLEDDEEAVSEAIWQIIAVYYEMYGELEEF